MEELASGSIPHVADSLLPILFAVVLAAGSGDEEDAQPPPWTVRSTEVQVGRRGEKASKGAAAFASRPLQRGELLIAERPICCWPQGLSEEQARELFEQLGEKEKKVYLALSRTEGDGPVKDLDEIRAIRATNGFALQLPGSSTTAGFVFPSESRSITERAEYPAHRVLRSQRSQGKCRCSAKTTEISAEFLIAAKDPR